MSPTVLVHLPQEALKAILAFMTRKQLVCLSAVNRQLYSIIDSQPLAMKPLFRACCCRIYGGVTGWEMTVNCCELGDRFAASEGVNHLEPILSLQWIRVDSEFHPSI